MSFIPGGAAIVEFDSMSEGAITLPAAPAVSGLITTFQDCNDEWTLVVGHSNIEIKASKFLENCKINAEGGDFDDARLIID